MLTFSIIYNISINIIGTNELMIKKITVHHNLVTIRDKIFLSNICRKISFMFCQFQIDKKVTGNPLMLKYLYF